MIILFNLEGILKIKVERYTVLRKQYFSINTPIVPAKI